MPRVTRMLRRHPLRTAAAAVALVVVGGGLFVARDVVRVAVSADSPHDPTLPLTTPLRAGDAETVYRIDAARSEATVTVEEILAGTEAQVELRTQVMAGDVAVADAGAGERSIRFGELVVRVHELRSDNSLRDKMLRHEYLESHEHPDVRLVDASVELPADAGALDVRGATLTGDLEVKGERHPTTWDVDARVVGDELLVTATTEVTMSELGVGPINKVGLVRTSDEVGIAVELVAVDATSFTPPARLAIDREAAREAAGEGAAEGSGGSGTSPSFADDIAPILESNCASCHRTGSIGAMMWTLDDAGDAAEVADGLAVVTGAGFMPPWPASDEGVPLQHVRGLDDAEVAAIAEWAAAGAPLDVDPDTPVDPPAEAEVREPRPDRVVTMAEPYKGSPEQKDDYRCFVLDPEVTEPSLLTAYTFDPGNLEVVHHAIVTRVRAGEQRAGAEARDAADEGPGWSCFAAMGSDGGERIAGWVPGQRPYSFPDGEGFELLPGDVLVAQIHYHYDETAAPDRSGMTLELTPAVPGTTALQSRTLIGPVEIPCPPGSAGALCDRDATLADVGERFGPGASVIANVLHRPCGTTPEQVAAASDGTTATTTCDFPVRRPGEIIGMLGHMHEMGASYRLELNPDTPGARVLLDIPVWNFAWQLAYAPVDDIAVAPGDVLRVTCRWDRRTRVDPEPRYVVFAEGTQDEMCYTSLTVRPTPEAPS